jgi:protein transport protein SEC24
MQVRPPMPPVFFFLIDVSMAAVSTGAVAAACSAVNRALADLTENPQTRVGIATFDSTIHFYNLNKHLQTVCSLALNAPLRPFFPTDWSLLSLSVKLLSAVCWL